MEKRLFETKLEALIACRNHWQFMEITGSSDKGEYEPSFEWDSGCACCEYIKEAYYLEVLILKKYCDSCPLRGYAWEKDCLLSENSFYANWVKADTPELRQFWAGRMVYACNQAIEKHLLNGKED